MIDEYRVALNMHNTHRDNSTIDDVAESSKVHNYTFSQIDYSFNRLLCNRLLLWGVLLHW